MRVGNNADSKIQSGHQYNGQKLDLDTVPHTMREKARKKNLMKTTSDSNFFRYSHQWLQPDEYLHIYFAMHVIIKNRHFC